MKTFNSATSRISDKEASYNGFIKFNRIAYFIEFEKWYDLEIR